MRNAFEKAQCRNLDSRLCAGIKNCCAIMCLEIIAVDFYVNYVFHQIISYMPKDLNSFGISLLR